MGDCDPKVTQLFDLTGRVAMVTGGTGYLGTAMCMGLAEAGASVVVVSRSTERSEDVVSSLPSPGGATHYGFAIDAMETDSLEERFSAVREAVGKVDVLVNNAVEWAAADWSKITPEQFSRHQENNTSYFILSRLVHDDAVRRNSSASIILLGSMYGMVGSYPDAYEDICTPSSVAYHALKGGTINMARHLAVYWAKDRVRVNCLSPGPFPQTKAPANLVERLKDKSPMGRMGQPHELKGAVVFLASDASSYMTGQNLVVDGGWTAW